MNSVEPIVLSKTGVPVIDGRAGVLVDNPSLLSDYLREIGAFLHAQKLDQAYHRTFERLAKAYFNVLITSERIHSQHLVVILGVIYALAWYASEKALIEQTVKRGGETYFEFFPSASERERLRLKLHEEALACAILWAQSLFRGDRFMQRRVMRDITCLYKQDMHPEHGVLSELEKLLRRGDLP